MVRRVILIYEVLCHVTGRSYIGITQRGERNRWHGHIRDAETGRSRSLLASAIRKYGPEKFSMLTIAMAWNRPDACYLERAIIADRRTIYPGGYNITPGGDGGCAKGRQFTAEHRHKLSEAAKRRRYSEAERAAISARQRGRKLTSEETRRKMSNAQKGKKMSPEAIAKTAAAQRGRKRSQETCQKIAESKRGIKQSESARQKKSAALKGRPRSIEARAAISRGWKLRAERLRVASVIQGES